ncbi:unnamed protein product [Boreogadus saida]
MRNGQRIKENKAIPTQRKTSSYKMVSTRDKLPYVDELDGFDMNPICISLSKRYTSITTGSMCICVCVCVLGLFLLVSFQHLQTPAHAARHVTTVCFNLTLLCLCVCLSGCVCLCVW